MCTTEHLSFRDGCAQSILHVHLFGGVLIRKNTSTMHLFRRCWCFGAGSPFLRRRRRLVDNVFGDRVILSLYSRIGLTRIEVQRIHCCQSALSASTIAAFSPSMLLSAIAAFNFCDASDKHHTHNTLSIALSTDGQRTDRGNKQQNCLQRPRELLPMHTVTLADITPEGHVMTEKIAYIEHDNTDDAGKLRTRNICQVRGAVHRNKLSHTHTHAHTHTHMYTHTHTHTHLTVTLVGGGMHLFPH